MRALLLLFGVGACGGKCIDVTTDCAPLYAPTFDDVFTHTLHPTCGAGGSSCHGAAGGKGGLVFDTADHAYSELLASRVVAGNPGCSLMVQKLESSDPTFQMPPGSPLAPAERCAIEQWIANGAQR